MKNFISSVLKTDLARSSGLIFLATFVGNLIVFVVNVFLSNILGPSNFGVFRTIFYLFTFLPLLIDFGISVSMTKYISELKKRSRKKVSYLVKYFLKIRIVSLIALTASIVLLRQQLSVMFLNDAILSYLIFPGAIVSALFFFNIFQYIVLGYQRFKLFALSQFLVLASSSIIGLALSYLGLFYLILGWGLGYLVGNAFSLAFFFREKIVNSSESFDVGKIFKNFSLPVHAVFIVNNLHFVIVPILSLFFSQELIGYFSFAFLFYFSALLIPNAISFVILPKISEMRERHADTRNLLERAFLFYTPVVFAGIVGVLLFSNALFSTFFPSYLPSLYLFKIVVTMGLLFGYNVIYTYYLQGKGDVKKFALFAILQNIILIAVSFGLLS
jgi:O-antigen/teichoic acid export membrane protein